MVKEKKSLGYIPMRCTFCGGLTSEKRMSRYGCCAKCGPRRVEPDLEEYTGQRPSTLEYAEARYNGTDIDELEW